MLHGQKLAQTNAWGSRNGAGSLCNHLTPESGLPAAVSAALDESSLLGEVELVPVPNGGESRMVSCKRALLDAVRARTRVQPARADSSAGWRARAHAARCTAAVPR